MINQIQDGTAPSSQMSSLPSESSPNRMEQNGQQSAISELIKQYVKQSTLIHRQRLQRNEQANQILAKQYRGLDAELDKTKENKGKFNRELDNLIGVLSEVDRLESGIIQCEKNSKVVFDLINQIQKKMSTKLQKKLEQLQKLKKAKK